MDQIERKRESLTFGWGEKVGRGVMTLFSQQRPRDLETFLSLQCLQINMPNFLFFGA
jgi:hypothetical protein